MAAVELNADIGEGMPWDASLMQIVNAVSVGLGEHAGNWEASLQTMIEARHSGLRVGLHPGFPDRAGFGRRAPGEEERGAWIASVFDQLDRAMDSFTPDYVKFHGGLYHVTQAPSALATSLSNWLGKHRLPLLGMPRTHHEEMAKSAGVPLIREGFCERGYRNGNLIPRGEPGAELEHFADIIAQATSLSRTVDSICIHGDRSSCVEIALAVREALAC